MKKIVWLSLFLCVLVCTQMSSQSNYTIAAGLGLDFSSDYTLVGPSGKFFLEEEHAILAELMFEDGITVITSIYQYHGDIPNATGLKWFAGAGPSFVFIGNGGGTEFALRPAAGLDFKVNNVPLVFSFDWRPLIGIGDLTNEIGAFGLGFRYAIN